MLPARRARAALDARLYVRPGRYAQLRRGAARPAERQLARNERAAQHDRQRVPRPAARTGARSGAQQRPVQFDDTGVPARRGGLGVAIAAQHRRHRTGRAAGRAVRALAARAQLRRAGRADVRRDVRADSAAQAGGRRRAHSQELRRQHSAAAAATAGGGHAGRHGDGAA